MPHTVLIVEDDAPLRQFFRHTLALAGYRVLEAGDGLTALQILDTEPVDLVVLDLGLPTVSGHVVHADIAARAQNVPILVVTGSNAKLRELQGTCVMRKPVMPDELLVAVRECLQTRNS